VGKQKVHPAMAVGLIVLAVIGLGVVAWRAFSGPSGDAKQVIVKPSHPIDIKTSPDSGPSGGAVKAGGV